MPEPIDLPPKLARQLETRATDERPPGAVAARDLARYYRLLADELAALSFSHQEAWLVYEAVRQARRDGGRGCRADAVEAEYRRQMGMTTVDRVNPDRLLATLRALSPAATLAIVDSAERLRARIERRGWDDLDVWLSTVERVRKRFVEAGLEAALRRSRPRRQFRRRLDGEQEAHLIALACSPPPLGRRRRTLRLLADKLVEPRYIDGVSHETVRQVLKKNRLKPWLAMRWCIPPERSGEFVWRMEDVLEVYTRPCDAKRLQVCMDEVSMQLLADSRPPRLPRTGQGKRVDYEYERRETANLFLCCEQLILPATVARAARAHARSRG